MREKRKKTKCSSKGKEKVLKGKKKQDSLEIDNNNQIEELEFLDELIRRLIERLRVFVSNSKSQGNNKYKPKVDDFLKAVQLKQKLKKASKGEKIFWELVEQIRKEELARSGKTRNQKVQMDQEK